MSNAYKWFLTITIGIAVVFGVIGGLITDDLYGRITCAGIVIVYGTMLGVCVYLLRRDRRDLKRAKLDIDLLEDGCTNDR